MKGCIYIGIISGIQSEFRCEFNVHRWNVNKYHVVRSFVIKHCKSNFIHALVITFH